MYLNKTEQIYEQVPDIKVVYCLLTGLSYRKIGAKFYHYQTGKFVYQVRKLFKIFNFVNRRHLAYFFVKNDLIDPVVLEEYQNA